MNNFKDRLSQKTTPPFMKKVRNIASIVAVICGAIMGAGVELPEGVNTIVIILASVSAALAGGAALTKKKDV